MKFSPGCAFTAYTINYKSNTCETQTNKKANTILNGKDMQGIKQNRNRFYFQLK